MTLLKSLALLCLLTALAAVALLCLAVATHPSVLRAPELAVADLPALQLLSADNDPRALKSGASATLALNEKDLELVLGYLLNRLQVGQAQVALGERNAEVDIAARLPVAFTELYLNVKATVQGEGNFLTVTDLRVGRVALPDWLAAKLLTAAQQHIAQRYPEYQRLQATIEEVSIAEQRLRVRYRWEPDLLRDLSRRGGEWLLPASLQELMPIYQARLRELAQEPNLPARISASEFLRPLFVYAHNRGGDPVTENRALLLVLSLYVLDLDVVNLGLDEKDLPRHELQLRRRSDWAQHFFVSIDLALGADVGLADNIGVLKEIEDTHGKGSGFSFTDIGADRTGARFAEFAVSSVDNARLLQRRMAESEGEAFYFPELWDLPEYLSQEDFMQTFGGTGSAAFQRELEQIDARIKALPVFSPAP
ncbi:MAG: hypothetical protein LBF16_05525 [Pseudomonadales bacterium]|jgi:hypothetical protein|nr:hypothetical protein [Pseudomonadales bacterium]